MKRNIVKIITFVAGLYFLLEFMLPAGVEFRHAGIDPARPARTNAAARIIRDVAREIVKCPEIYANNDVWSTVDGTNWLREGTPMP